MEESYLGEAPGIEIFIKIIGITLRDLFITNS